MSLFETCIVDLNTLLRFVNNYLFQFFLFQFYKIKKKIEIKRKTNLY